MRTRPVEWPKSGFYWHLHHDRLIEWTDDIDERWNYVVTFKNEKELEIRLHLMRPVVGELSAEWNKVNVEWDKASAECDKASAELDKVNAELNKARAELNKARAEWDKARAEWNKARAELNKASAEWNKVSAEYDKASADPVILALHARECPCCPWDGKTIFST